MNSTFCKMLINLSTETWERIKFSRNRTGLKIFETTITQNILYSIHKYYKNLPISIYEAIDEKTNGNDLEIFLHTKAGYIFLPTQAKIIYSSYKYESIDHNLQIDSLLNYAKLKNGFPMYLLYNYVSNFNPSQTICGISLNDYHYGCTITSAQFLFDNFAYQRKDKNGNSRWIIPSFDSLHPNHSFPWLILGCCNFEENIIEKFKTDFKSLRRYSRNELIENKWIEIDFNKEITEDFFSINNNNENKFSPKFRVIIDTIIDEK